MALPAIPIISGIIGLFKMGGELFRNWQDKKLIQAQAKVEIEKAKAKSEINLAEQGQLADIQADKSIIDQMSFTWKDEYLTIIFTMPAILVFVPGLAPHIERGFEVLAGLPQWYQILLILVAASGLGLRKFIDKLMDNIFSR